ncbi:uncharacterized protein EV420DRAFT_1764543 [Desarmillaria tabescens]|uniref:Uncharacterized protein n=1 Tax=Armillaria tabescens TaxID=1929756 RepID=A0AA39KBI5_ARMTA|nr:uncharacterized protein EV420DRAFT_1764543 [Desarmillaria tabescens]KAK0458050.1 hypothetical protein EV420DRAFT_1764543 [Desarmillaria tabescens]
MDSCIANSTSHSQRPSANIHLNDTRTELFGGKSHGNHDFSVSIVSSPSLSRHDGAHLELELTSNISEGRVGLAYSARVLHNTADTDFPDLCIKLVKPKYGRTLAREAWFYEQLSLEPEYEGAITPRCFGFFTPVTRVEPWENSYITIDPPEPHSDQTDDSDEEEDIDWWLPYDPPGLDDFFKDDDGLKSGSSWNE